MATQKMVDAISISRDNVWKGAARVVIGDADLYVSFPGVLESVMQPSSPADPTKTAYALAANLTDIGGTSEDGVTLRRAAELGDGIPIDQLGYNLDESEPEGWTMECELVIMDTTLENFQIAWEAGELVAIPASEGVYVAQHKLELGAPTTFTERMLFVIQEDPKTGNLRIFAFRQATPAVDSEVVVKKGEASQLPLTFKLHADPSYPDDPFGVIFEED